MARVDPFIENIPLKFINDPELAPFFNYLNLFLHDLWIRTGGGNDNVDTVTLDANTFQIPELYGQISKVTSDVDAIIAGEDIAVIERVEFRAITVTSNYTAVDHDFINAKSNATISFTQYPQENSVIIVRNGDGSDIGLDGNGRNINGSPTGSINRLSTSIEFHYFIDTDEWFAK